MRARSGKIPKVARLRPTNNTPVLERTQYHNQTSSLDCAGRSLALPPANARKPRVRLGGSGNKTPKHFSFRKINPQPIQPPTCGNASPSQHFPESFRGKCRHGLARALAGLASFPPAPSRHVGIPTAANRRDRPQIGHTQETNRMSRGSARHEPAIARDASHGQDNRQ